MNRLSNIITFAFVLAVASTSNAGLVFDNVTDLPENLDNVLVVSSDQAIIGPTDDDRVTDVVIFDVDGDDVMAMSGATFSNGIGTPPVPLQFSDIPVTSSGGVDYFRFFLRFNEPGSPSTESAFVDQFELSVGATTYFRLFETSAGAGDGSLPLDTPMGTTDDVEFGDIGPGNNQSDGYIDVPLSTFVGLTSDDTLKISATFSGISAGNDFIAIGDGTVGSFLPTGTPVAVPEPSAFAFLGLLGVVGLAISRVGRWWKSAN